MEATERAISKPSDFHNKDALTQGYGRSPEMQDIEIGPEQVLVSHSNAHEESLSFRFFHPQAKKKSRRFGILKKVNAEWA